MLQKELPDFSPHPHLWLLGEMKQTFNLPGLVSAGSGKVGCCGSERWGLGIACLSSAQ